MILAIFIDFENVYYGLINQYNFKPQTGHLISLILKELSKDGNLLIKKAYADWERVEFQGAQAACKKAGVEPAFALSKKTVKEKVSVWKETADAALMLDALQTLFERPDIEQYVLVTGDRATLDLIHRLSSRGKKVKICALESAIAKELTDAVGEENVISIEGLLGIEPAGPPPAPATPLLANGKADWPSIIRQFAQLEDRLPFVALKLARDRYGFAQAVITEGQKLGIFQTLQMQNPNNPKFPTTALKLDRSNELVKGAIGA
ncbi:MAG: NYN domain-containing protein [Acidobacteria bacterium]|nr:NYN domain-containing protein [Acidobacteriota bacterium]